MDQIDRVAGITGSEDKNPDLNNLCDDMRKAGMKVTNQFKGLWRTGIQYFWGNQLRNMKEVKRNWEYVVVNRIRPLMMQNISKLAKNDPKILTHAWDQEKEDADKFVEAWAGHLQYLWNSPYKLNMRAEIIKGLMDAGLFGYMVGKTIWDDKVRWVAPKKAWHEDVEHTFVHPILFWMDPAAENMKTARNCGTFRPRIELEWAQARWPEFKEELKKEAYTSQDKRYTEGQEVLYESQKGDTLEKNKSIFNRMAGLILKHAFGKDNAANEQTGDQLYVTIEEIYWKDETTKKVKIEDVIPAERLAKEGRVLIEAETGVVINPETGQPMTKADWPTEVTDEYDEPQFPQGRFVLRIGRCILNPEEKDQVYTESRWPFEVMPYHILPHMWQGENAIESGRLNNDILNLSVSAMVNQMMRTADPTKLVEAGAMAKGRDGKVKSTRDDITGLGRVVIVAKGAIKKIMNMVYPPLDASTLLVAEMMKQDIDETMHMPPVARGQKEKKGGNTSATEAAKLDVNAHDYTAMQAIFLDIWIDNTATLIAELCQSHYEPGRMMRVLNKDGQGFRTLDQAALDVRFDVNIEPGSTLPFDEEKKQAEVLKAYELCNAPVANPMLEEALQVLNISNRQEILARHKGFILFHQFIQLGQMVAQVPPEDLKAVVEKMPYLQPVIELLMQAGQLAPQTGMAQPEKKPDEKQKGK
jgi:hypothetical protein